MERHEKLSRDFCDMGILFNGFAVQLTQILHEAQERKEEIDEFDMLALETIHDQTAEVAKQLNMLKYALDGKVWFKEILAPKQS